jgi:hypothetical protein
MDDPTIVALLLILLFAVVRYTIYGPDKSDE